MNTLFRYALYNEFSGNIELWFYHILKSFMQKVELENCCDLSNSNIRIFLVHRPSCIYGEKRSWIANNLILFQELQTLFIFPGIQGTINNTRTENWKSRDKRPTRRQRNDELLNSYFLISGNAVILLRLNSLLITLLVRSLVFVSLSSWTNFIRCFQ